MQWNRDGAAWRRWTPSLDRWYGEATCQTLHLARVQPGQRLLDIAAGAGEPAVSAAERVGPAGYVLATDISEGILELALQVARERGLRQIETHTMDGEILDLPDACFDVVLCRLPSSAGARNSRPHRITSAAEYVQVAREAFGGFNAMMAHLSFQERDSVWSEVEDSRRSFETAAGFEAPGECLVGVATK
jgi:SAM-dependent methyltransferase